MLRLEKLELRGFKSFCEATEIVFHEGITAVVGPNGCGKSNILDAVSWVLGEQSARHLRGQKMDDLIFNGTRDRRPLGMAEVVLTLIATGDVSPSEGDKVDAGDEPEVAEQEKRGRRLRRLLPEIAAGERVTIARRVYRSGEGEYLMNGHQCRLRDIQEFFAGTGLGGAQYAIIEQGHIGQVLSSRPQDRRALIEEAAGITRFKAKKHQAELKLEAARQNLSRLADIIAEVDRQLGLLKRQAAKARKYKRLREQMRGFWRGFFRAEHARLNQTLSSLEAEIASAGQSEREFQRELSEREGLMREAQVECIKREAVLEAARQSLSALQLEEERLRARLAHGREQSQELSERRSACEREVAASGERVLLMDKEIERRRADFSALEQSLSAAELESKACEREHQQQVASLATLEAALEETRSSLMREVSKTERLRHLKHQLEEAQKRVNLEQRQLQKEAVKAEERKLHCLEELNRLKALQAEAGAELTRLSAGLRGLDLEIEALQARQRRERERYEELTRQQARAEDRAMSLTDLYRKRAYFSEAVQTLLTGGEQDFTLLGTLADLLEVEPQYEQAAERALGDYLGAVLLPTLDDALAASRWLRQHGGAPVTLLVTGLHGGSETVAERKLEADTLLAALGLSPEIEAVFKRAWPELAGAKIVEDLMSALEVSARDPQSIVLTSSGDRVRACTLLEFHGAKESDGSVLRLKREIRELEADAEKLRSERLSVSEELAGLERELARLEQERREYDTDLRRREREQASLKVELQQSERELERALQQLRVVASELERKEEEKVSLEGRLKQVAVELLAAEAARLELEEALQRSRSELERLKPEVERVRQRFTELKAIAAATAERRRSAANELRRLEEERRHLQGKIEQSRFELLQLETKSQELREGLSKDTRSFEELQARLINCSSSVKEAEAALASARERTSGLEPELSELRSRVTQARERRAVLEIEQARVTSELEHIEQSCQSELQRSLAELLTEEEHTDEEVLDIDELRRKVEELGPVNMMALEELEETEKRAEFLRLQQRDILESISATEEALSEIRRRSRQRFREAFESINQNFQQMFVEMFGGGRGEMILIDESDPLESGIDIIAQPPGKRLQSVLLLSGGEKAMAAMALVLAIFQYRPSPFCVLDEVDAPLDDVNISRFASRIQSMSQKTQFLVITHNKRTMEIAQHIYGVTMQEPGVSRLISVKLKPSTSSGGAQAV